MPLRDEHAYALEFEKAVEAHIEKNYPAMRAHEFASVGVVAIPLPFWKPNKPGSSQAGLKCRDRIRKTMKFAGLLVMPAGFFLSIAALVLFPANAAVRAAFVLCGLGVEALGLVVAVRGHMEAQGKART
jgi:hypothetical protein